MNMNRGNKAILVIDSERSWLEFCANVLTREGYKVYTALTTQEALDLAATLPENNLEFVVIDVISFEEDPSVVEDLSQVHAGSKWSVVVVFSTDLTPNRTRAAFKLGVTDCISKPYDETGLLVLVEQVFAERRLAEAKKRLSTEGSSNILIVEDDDDWTKSLVKYLPTVDQAVTASSYPEAVEKISSQLFDLIVVDLRLVDADDTNFQGMDLIPLIREKDKERGAFTQVIIVSAYGTPEHVRESYRAFDIYYYFDKRYLSPVKYRDSIKEALIL